ncbi:type II toxin-antitoxin system HicA family toxin [Anaerocellum danielii]|uniref:Type II toxin-antitoxin system HicA family toxin n=1 Tax=Anaerocellum danielii TaxID=1387557 RepID=A0ABZ0TZS3_9FIRM|nr:type II toxin-antitoxin system HicA family toxin [Caldicellulosiruptor danielii]WPX08734.1 type II toxin-antitoxin system HicA family toxin [Caldicellulosiruptor danielii]
MAQKGNHLKLKKENPTRIVIIPMHEEVARGTLKSILEQAGISLEEFLKLL